MRLVSVFFFISCLSSSIFSIDEPVYQIKEILSNSDIDEAFVSEIDSITPPFPKNSNFAIGDLKYKKGKYTVYKFMNVDWGDVSYQKEKVLIHKILVLKVDDKNVIQSGYHFTLEWQDVPSYNVYRVKKKKTLKQGLLISELGLELLHKESSNQILSGILDNVFGAKKEFK